MPVRRQRLFVESARHLPLSGLGGAAGPSLMTPVRGGVGWLGWLARSSRVLIHSFCCFSSSFFSVLLIFHIVRLGEYHLNLMLKFSSVYSNCECSLYRIYA